MAWWLRQTIAYLGGRMHVIALEALRQHVKASKISRRYPFDRVPLSAAYTTRMHSERLGTTAQRCNYHGDSRLMACLSQWLIPLG
jgi:hypothetical protein